MGDCGEHLVAIVTQVGHSLFLVWFIGGVLYYVLYEAPCHRKGLATGRALFPAEMHDKS